jgi:hypothetical protein
VSADILVAIKELKLMGYLLDPWNVIDWLHMVLMWAGWALWLLQYQGSQSFSMYPNYYILESAGARARLFKTQSEEELNFLNLCSNLRTLSQNLSLYVSITAICGKHSSLPSNTFRIWFQNVLWFDFCCFAETLLIL